MQFNVRKQVSMYLLVLGLAGLAAGCARPYYSHSFKTDGANALRALKVLAIAPVEVPSDLPKADQARQFFDSAISERLRLAGFQVVGQEAYTQIMTALTREKGGAFDVVTGKKDEKKFHELKKYSLMQLQATTGANALLRAKVVPVSARFSGCQASWDGTTQDVARAHLGIFCPTANMFGKVAAFSLVVTLEDIDSNILYFNGGGIQLLTQFIESFPGGNFQEVPKEQLLGDETRNRAAVDIVLGPLVIGARGK